MHFSFEEWLLLTENMTAAQFLKLPANKEYVNSVKNQITTFVAEHFHNVNQNILVRYTNWFAKELIVQKVQPGHVPAVLANWWDNLGDWMAGNVNNNQFQSRFNLVDFTYAQAVEAAVAWHNEMKGKNIPGREGRTVVSLENVPGFQGWRWVALDRAYCDKEAEAMGHCGNEGGSSPQNIVSLRDPENLVHLTFINNKGELGEMKGRGNSKPSVKYHPAIIKLLLSNEIGTIKGGGYAPMNNFALEDLTPEQQAAIKAQKPYIDNPAGFADKRQSMVQGLQRKEKNLTIQNSTPENVGQVVKDLINNKMKLTRMWDEKPEDDPPGQVTEKILWRFFTFLLNETYTKGRQRHPAELFSWMDSAIEAMVATLVEADIQIIKRFEGRFDQKGLLWNMSNMVKLTELVHNLQKEQPEVMRGAPKRTRFGNYEDYVKALRRYLDLQGYDLPGYRPDNHMISYEFNEKVMAEIKKQGKVVLDLLDKGREELDPRINAINDRGLERRMQGQFDTTPAKDPANPPRGIRPNDLDNMVHNLP